MRAGDESGAEENTGADAAAMNVHALQGQTVRGSLWTVLGTAAGVPLALLAIIVAARFLDLAEFGRFSLYGFLVPIALATLDLGLGASLAWLATSGRGNAPAVVISALRTLVTWNALKLPIVVAGSVLLLREELGAGILLAVSLAAFLLSQGLSTALTADRRYRSLSQASVLTAAVSTLAVIAAVISTRSAEWGIAAFWAGRIATVPYLWHATPADLRRAAVLPGRMHIDRRSWSFGLSSYVAGLMGLWVFGRSELLFLERHGDARALGQFALVSTVAQRATLLADALFGALGIALVALKGAKDERFVAALTRALRLTTLVAITAGIALIPIVSLLAPPLFGSQFGELSLAVAWMLSFALLRTGTEPLYSWIYAERVGIALVVPGVAAAVLDVILSLILIPKSPFIGAIAANSASTLTFITLSACLGRLPPIARREFIVCVLRLIPVLAWCVACVAIDLPGPLLLRVVETTMLTMSGVVIATMFLPPLLAKSEVESIMRSVPRLMRPGLALALTLFNGRTRSASQTLNR